MTRCMEVGRCILLTKRDMEVECYMNNITVKSIPYGDLMVL